MLTLNFAGLRIYNDKKTKVLWEEMEHSQMEMNQGTDAWVAGYNWLLAGKKPYPF